MFLKTKSGRKVKLPTPEEEAVIQAGIDSDSDTYELSDTELKQLKRVGRPQTTTTKERITIRLSRDVVESFRASGAGWQARMDEALKEWLRTHEKVN